MKLYEQQYPACRLEMCAKGFLSSAFLQSLGLPVSERNPDGLSDKSQLCMLLTGDARRKELLARELAQQHKVQKAADAKAAREEKQVRASLVLATKATQRGRGTYTKKIRTHTNMQALRAESDRVELQAGDVECCIPACGMKWSVFQAHEDTFRAEMRQCKHCQKYVCCLCLFALEDFMNGHENQCLRNTQVSAMVGKLQQAAILEIQRRHDQEVDQDEEGESGSEGEMEDGDDM
jgi:hypothetical protein